MKAFGSAGRYRPAPACEIVKALAQPEIRQRLSALGFEPAANTRDAFATWIKAEIPRWRRVIHGVNILKVE